MKKKSVQSKNPCQSVIQTIYDIVKARWRAESRIQRGRRNPTKYSITSVMKNTSVSSLNFMILLSVLLFLTTNTVKASADSLFVVSGNMGGIGVRFEVDSLYQRITQISPNRPAYRSGQLKVGDRIIGVGQGASGEIIDINGKTSEGVSDMLRGRVGTMVRLAILPADNIKSDPPLIVELVRESIHQVINISNVDTWYFKPGDSLNWAKPDYDDSNWYPMSPGGLAIEEMPDSLWNGYGWWRLTFTADSTFYAKNWTMYYFGWGAAEVYLDGQLVHSFGNFSINQDQERTFSPIGQIYPPVRIFDKKTHTIAVRYSYHQAKQYNFFMKKTADNLGFNIGFGTHAYNEYIATINTFTAFALFVSGAVLFVLLLLHLMLYYKFPEDRANLLLTITFALLLISVLTGFHTFYADATRYWYNILEFIWTLSVSFSMLFLPYVIASMFKLENLKKVLWLVAGLPLLVIIGFFNSELPIYIFLVFVTLLVFFVGYICWQAYREKRKGVHYVALAALATFSVAMFFILYGISNAQLDFRSHFIMAAFFYTLFPLGLTLYVADRYGYLFTSLEKEVDERTYELNQSLETLKATQSQLIQSEKLASLGELTAGIAHEIQNPLNFVNNFSEVSTELIDEMKAELKKGDIEEGIAIADDLKQNLEKINHHGQRASSIVKGMLEHSRTSTGQKEPTDINALCDEYLRLAYHGLRAKDKSFNADYKTDFDPNLPRVNVVSQDIGRVILNLINNAFQAVGTGHAPSQQPMVTVSTRNLGDKIEISVKDNGPGIPDSIKDKIFQPFFTTKPTGQGTGLGLSLSYDIVKAHGGSIKIESNENEGATFTIQLPI